MRNTIDSTGRSRRQKQRKQRSGGDRRRVSSRFLSLLLSVCLLSALLSGCASPSGSSDRFQKTGTYFDTVITVTVYKRSQEKYLEGCMKLAKKYEDLLSTTVKDSDIARINRAGGKTVTVDQETADVIEKGLYYSKISDGKFDITVGKLSKLWQKALKEEKVPSEEDVEKARETVDYKLVSLDGRKVTIDSPDTEIDLGGIAKGYIADRMREYLEKNGVKEAIINLGGNVLTLGERKGTEGYRIGIQKPFGQSGEARAVVTVHDLSVVTSGIYERYFEGDDGTIYHHILNLETGWPMENGISSATVFTKNSTDGDALSTIAFLMGPEEGVPFIESLGYDVLYIKNDGTLVKSDGIGSDVPFEEVN